MLKHAVTPLAPLLQRGRAWEEEGKLHQAIAIYFRLMEYHGGTEEAVRARGQLVNLAQQFEAAGKVHQATHLYHRLAALPQLPRRVQHDDQNSATHQEMGPASKR